MSTPGAPMLAMVRGPTVVGDGVAVGRPGWGGTGSGPGPRSRVARTALQADEAPLTPCQGDLSVSTDAALDLLLTGGRLVMPGAGETRAAVGVAEGRIVALLDDDSRPPARQVLDLGGKVVLPGVIDPHTHVTLGPPDGWFTETRAAALGGITTILDFQLLSSSYVEAYPAIRREADARTCVDYGLHFCPSVERHLDELDVWVRDIGVSSFKFYMNFRGDEGAYLGVAGADDGYLWELCQRVARHPRGLLCLHTENIEIANRLQARLITQGREGLGAWGAARPPVTEAENVNRAGFFARETGCPVYIVHMSSAAALREIRLARAQGARVYAETCPRGPGRIACQEDRHPRRRRSGPGLPDRPARGRVNVATVGQHPASPPRTRALWPRWLGRCRW